MSDLQHFGVKGMRWGVRKKITSETKTYKKTLKTVSRDEHGRQLSEKSYPEARSLIRNGSAWAASQVATYGVVAGLATLIGPAALAAGAPAGYALAIGGNFAQLISTGVASGKTVSELRSLQIHRKMNKTQAKNEEANRKERALEQRRDRYAEKKP